ncbi:MAG: hypothetical protein HFE64_10050 [Lachnospiraceae bacterium]|jgi:hypothetical protein|nr:hypothetical protein [Lachnospiraceae bacterium]
MEGMFLEQMVKRGNKQQDSLMRVIIVVCALIIASLPFIISLSLAVYVGPVLIVVMALVVWILWRRVAKEYEYIYTDGNLDIDVIYGRSTRQHLVTFDCRQCRMIVPASIKRYEQEIYEKKYDKTIQAGTGKMTESTYVILGSVGDKQYRVFFEPNEALLEAIYTYSPRNTVK